MDNLNNGRVVDFNQIDDYQKAAKDFSEGNKELENLLLNCFSKGIKTVACCGGHENENRKPYISFSYSYENEQYIYAIISKLKDSGLNFRYNKLSDGKSFFSVEAGQTFDFNKTSALFNSISYIINSFDIEKNYYEELPRDLQIYSSIVKSSENDEFLKTNGTSDYFQMCYQKDNDGYKYSMFTSDSYYNSFAEKTNFIKTSITGMFPSYDLKVPNREMAIQDLNGIATNIKSFSDKKSELQSFQEVQPLKQKEEIELSFEYDERTRSNPLINHLKVNPGDTIEIVAQKLTACREKGINAFTVFNDVEVNNYKSDNPEQIIEIYNQNKKYEHFINMRNNQRQQDQIIREQQLGQLLQQDIQQMEGMKK